MLRIKLFLVVCCYLFVVLLLSPDITTGYGPRSMLFIHPLKKIFTHFLLFQQCNWFLSAILKSGSKFGWFNYMVLFNLIISDMSSGTVESKFVIDKLTGANYGVWSMKVKMMLMKDGLWGLIDGTDVLEGPPNQPELSAYSRKVAKAIATIGLSVDDSFLLMIGDKETPKAMWDALKEHFQSDSLANELFLRRKFYQSRMSNGVDVQSHINSLRDIQRQLAGIQCKISEREFVMTLLGSLPDSWQSLITALESRAGDLTLSFVQQRLLHEESRRKEAGETTEASGGYVEAFTVGKFSKKAEFKDKKSCRYCGKQGHLDSNCYKLRSFQKQQSLQEDSVDHTNNTCVLSSRMSAASVGATPQLEQTVCLTHRKKINGAEWARYPDEEDFDDDKTVTL